MNAIDLLTQQHEDARNLFGELENAEDDVERQALFQQLANVLASHATIEEQVFYPAAYAQKTRAMLTEAVEEHLAMKRILADLLELLPDDDSYEAKIKVLEEQFERHVEAEEGDIFEAVREELGEAKLEQLGERMTALYDEEVSDEPSEAIPDQTGEAAPLR